ncbi:ABC transporter substrate-binding protein [Eubacterium oxidoreducens]|uniref:Branched-chain amino acid transport system substrate-binding protein n=1 Tax=Eubacterium oxidoreducens TaxID=1732 RepID=A0A1G6C8C5_EUBOX|nr:ABC transporter substrate-binding protein [Eubacterium oxidoreducens]SDB29139.1 branched-chain amino acid transport system substrate-binding protein [Eubacterium oxidoreducens]
MKKRLTRIAALGVAALMVGSLAACGSSSSSSSTNEGGSSSSSGDTITVGVVYPQTGALAAFGAGTEEMYGYAVDEINEAGGIEVDGTTKKIQLVYADSESDPTKASEAANNLIKSKNVDIMLTAKTADTTVPVAAACERAGVLCLSVDTPDEAWATSDYQYSYHAGFNTENELNSFKDAWDAAGISGGKVGVMHATDTEGQTMINAISEFCEANGYEAVDPGAYNSGDTDYTSIINSLKAEGCDAVVGVMLTSDFGTFYSQLKSSGYMPKVTTVAKATLFKEDVDAAGADGLADGLCSEVWWTTSHPYVSSITGETCEELGAKWMELTGDEYAPATCGYDYANVEILYNVLKNAGSLNLDKLTAACDELSVDTVIGKVDFNEQHYSVQPLVTGQWIYNDDGSWTQEIIANTQVPDCPTTAELKVTK